jgi:hypothetical protein
MVSKNVENQKNDPDRFFHFTKNRSVGLKKSGFLEMLKPIKS